MISISRAAAASIFLLLWLNSVQLACFAQFDAAATEHRHRNTTRNLRGMYWNTTETKDMPDKKHVHRRTTSENPAGHYHQRMYHHNYYNSTAHSRRSWTVLEEVDGLKNDEVVIFVLSTWNFDGMYLRERVIASTRTWMRLFANVIVIVEDTFHVRYAMRHCRVDEYEGFTTMTCHNEATYLLTRRCSDAYYVASGPCCKVDSAIDFLVNRNPGLFARIKYMILSDDDQYWRPDQLLRWLASVERSGLSDVYPLAGNSHEGEIQEPRGQIFHIQNCGEIQTSGWYQPLFLNHLALERLKVAVASFGFRDICRSFDLSQDAGIGILLWMYEMYHIHIPRVDTNDDHLGIPALQPDQLSIHFIKHEEQHDHCEDGRRWPDSMRHKQNIVVGCGDIDQSSPGHNGTKNWADMYDVWKYFQHNGKDVILDKAGINEYEEIFVLVEDRADAKRTVLRHVLSDPKPGTGEDASHYHVGDIVRNIDNEEVVIEKHQRIEQKIIPRLIKLTGYRNTRHHHEHNVMHQWTPFTLEDCDPPGKID